MSLGHCEWHGPFDGWECPICSVKKDLKNIVRAQERSRGAGERGEPDVLAQAAEERRRQEAEEAAEERAQRLASATEAVADELRAQRKSAEEVEATRGEREAARLVAKAETLLQAELHADAVPVLMHAVEASPTDPAIRLRLAEARHAAGDAAGAAEAVRAAAKLAAVGRPPPGFVEGRLLATALSSGGAALASEVLRKTCRTPVAWLDAANAVGDIGALDEDVRAAIGEARALSEGLPFLGSYSCHPDLGGASVHPAGHLVASAGTVLALPAGEVLASVNFDGSWAWSSDGAFRVGAGSGGVTVIELPRPAAPATGGRPSPLRPTGVRRQPAGELPHSWNSYRGAFTVSHILAIAPNGARAVFVGKKEKLTRPLLVVDNAARRLETKIEVSSYQQVEGAAFSPDATVLAVMVHGMTKPETGLRVLDLPGGRELWRHDMWTNHPFVFGPDGSWLALSDAGEGQVRDARTGYRLVALEGGSRGRWHRMLATTAERIAGITDSEVDVWERSSGRRLANWAVVDAAELTALALSDDGKMIALGDAAGVARVYAADTGEALWKSEKLGTGIHSLTFGPGATTLAAGASGAFEVRGQTVLTALHLWSRATAPSESVADVAVRSIALIEGPRTADGEAADDLEFPAVGRRRAWMGLALVGLATGAALLYLLLRSRTADPPSAEPPAPQPTLASPPGTHSSPGRRQESVKPGRPPSRSTGAAGSNTKQVTF